jgi:hypothetical protein
MNPYAGLYLQVHKQYARDLAGTYQNAQRGWAPASRMSEAFRRLRRQPSPTTVTPLPASTAEQATDARVHARAA